MKLMMFVKHVQSLPLAKAAQTMREIGFEGMDLTVRVNGVIQPERARQELPRTVELLASCGLQVPLLTTDILRADDNARSIMETAASVGIQEIKLGYHHYRTFGSFKENLAAMHRDIESIEKLAKSCNIRANLHIHSGEHMEAQSAIVWDLIRDRDPSAIGAYIDPGHMFVEGGRDVWRQGIDLLRERINMVAIKDLAWQPVVDDSSDKPRWTPKVVPLRKGIVQWDKVFALLRELGYNGWLSIHAEYADLDAAQVFEQTRDDVAYLKNLLSR
jgi:sugar phosphate isomerase/epimerase